MLPFSCSRAAGFDDRSQAVTFGPIAGQVVGVNMAKGPVDIGCVATVFWIAGGVMPWSMSDKVENLEFGAPVFVPHDETLRKVAHMLWVENIGAVVVRDERGTVGIISERDLIAKVAQGADLDRMTAEEIMTKYMVAAKGGDTLSDAAYQMLDQGIRHLPVVDDEARVVGMVSVRDLLRPLLSGEPPESKP